MADLESIATEKDMPASEIEEQGKISKRSLGRSIGSLVLIYAGACVLLANPILGGIIVIGGGVLAGKYITNHLKARDYLIEAGVEDRYS